MFKFLKRSAPATALARERPVTQRAAPDHRDHAPVPLPEVIEGDGEADWSLWEESVTNSQLQPLSDFGGISAFDKVGKRDQ
jgi:hypothetical protein